MITLRTGMGAATATLASAGRRLFNALPEALRLRWPLAVVLSACVLAALGGALVPVGGAAAGMVGDAAERLPAGAVVPQPPELAAFLTNRRWGVSVLEERQRRTRQADEEAARQAATTEPPPAPSLQALGLVGVAVNASERAVLLALPHGDVIRLVAGDALADGRVLVSVLEDALVLEGANAERETLRLFPPPAPES